VGNCSKFYTHRFCLFPDPFHRDAVTARTLFILGHHVQQVNRVDTFSPARKAAMQQSLPPLQEIKAFST